MIKKIALVLSCFISSQCWSQIPGLRQPDSVVAVASNKYDDPTFLQRVFLGKNYRKTWSTPVTLPVFNLKASGMTIGELGGGMQTKSLRLIDKDSVTWVLRTIDKDPSEAIARAFRNKLTVAIMQQMISGAYPYAPVVVAPLAKAASVTATEPIIYWVPDDAGFKEHRELFANTVCMLERKDVTPEAIDVHGTDDILPKFLGSSQYNVDQRIYLRARLLDMLIADWDRHADQWAWAERKAGAGASFEALPKDRDQAFFMSKGLLIKIARAISVKHLVGFTNTTSNLKKLNNKSLNMDRLFLNELTYNDWHSILQKFYGDLSDSVISNAVHQIPPNVYKLDGQMLTNTLISRRNGMLKDVMQYYLTLADNVAIYGTDDAEVFEIKGDAEMVTVTVRSKKDNSLAYQRTFNKKETEKIEVYGLGGDDVIRCTNGNRFRISVSVDDGSGNDEIMANNSDAVKIRSSDMNAAAANLVLRKDLKIKPS